MIAYKPNPATCAALVREAGVLVCGEARCTRALNIEHDTPAPGSVGWVLRDGWWLCPEHADEAWR